MIGQNPKTEVAPFAAAEIGVRKISFGTEVVVNRWGQISRQTPGKESGKNLGQAGELNAFKPELYA